MSIINKYRHNLSPITLFTNINYSSTKQTKEERELGQITNIDSIISVKMFNYIHACNIALASAIEMHNQWRKRFIAEYGDVQFIIKNKAGVDINVNVDGKLLINVDTELLIDEDGEITNEVGEPIDMEFLDFYYTISLFAATYLIIYKYAAKDDFISVIHKKWLIINPGGRHDLLPDIQKQTYHDMYQFIFNYLYTKK